MTLTRTYRTLLGFAVAVALTVGLVPHAHASHADWSAHVAYKRQGSVCYSDGTNVVIGSKMFQKELGKKGVTRMRIKFLLYKTNPYDSLPEFAYLQKTKYSAYFPDDTANYWWDASHGAKHTWTVSAADSDEYWIIAKLTWERPAKPDWNEKLPAAYCQWSGV